MRTRLATLVSVLALGCSAAEPPAPAAPSPPPAPPAPVAPVSKPPEAAAQPKPDVSKALLAYVEAFNAGKIDEAMQAFHDDAEWISQGSMVRPATGREEIARALKELRDIFAIRVGVRRLFVKEDMWVAQGVLSGTHVGDFHGFKPTNKPVGTEYIHIGWVQGGRIKRLVSLSNGFAFPRQIGFAKGEAPAVPPAPQGPVEVVTAAGDPKNVEVVERMMAAGASKDVGTLAAFFAPGAVMEERAVGKTTTGADAIKAAIAQKMETMSGFAKKEATSFAAGPYVVAHGVTSATYTPPSADVKTKPAPIPVTYAWAHVVKLDGGKVVASESYRNPVEIEGQAEEQEPAAAPGTKPAKAPPAKAPAPPAKAAAPPAKAPAPPAKPAKK
jgi:ketosteroid isomerase-like protein